MDWTRLIRKADVEQLMRNAAEQAPLKGTRREKDFQPVVKLHLPFTYCVWLITEMESDGMAFGLCDLGAGFPELGSVWVPELMDINVRGLRVKQDLDWTADKPLSGYAEIARQKQRIIA